MDTVRMPKRLKINELSMTWNILLNIAMILFSLACLLPVLLVYSVAFSSEKSIAEHGYSFIPREFSLSAFDFYLKSGEQVVNSYAVSLFVTVVGTIISVLVTSLFAYSLSRKSFKYRNVFTFITFFTMLFNGGLVPSYIINTRYLHLNDNLLVLFLPLTLNAFYVIVLRTFFSTTIPESVIESAKIDGAGEITTFFRIVFPLSKPGLATIGLFCVIGLWNDWFTGLLYITNPRLVSIQYMLYKIQNSIEFIRQNSRYANSPEGLKLLMDMPNESGRMALVVIVITPILFTYPFFQRYFVHGLTIGSIKG